MKTSLNAKKMSFGFATVNAGQRNQVIDPQFIAVSTQGGFRITPPVSRALGIASGDYIMFITNTNNIQEAINNQDPIIVEFCQENGLELGTTEATIAIHKEFDMYGIAKGIVEFDAKGNIKTSTERLSKKDKVTYVTNNFDEMLEAAMEQADDEVKDALSRDGITKEEQIEILSTFVQARELPKHKGSKTANSAGLSGIGTALSFTDTNMWNQLKVDLGEDASKMNRIYDVDLENIQDVVVNDGYKDVTVKALILGDYVDKAPSRIGREEGETEE